MGFALVQAGLELLIHRMELRQGQAHDYRIVVSTEWNFQGDGVVANHTNNSDR